MIFSKPSHACIRTELWLHYTMAFSVLKWPDLQERHLLFLEHLSFWKSVVWILRLQALSTRTWKRDLAHQTSNSQWPFFFFQWSWINNRWHIMCDLKGLCNTVPAGERLLCPKSSHQVLWNNTTLLATATWEQHHCTRCGNGYTHEQERTHLNKCTNMAWGSLGQGGGLWCTWPSAGGHFSTAHPIRGEWWSSGEAGCWRPL